LASDENSGRIVLRQDFVPPRWLANRHLATLWASRCQRRPRPRLQRTRVTLPDGDFVDLFDSETAGGEPVLILHGLEGNHDSHYVRELTSLLESHGFQATAMDFRGCSGEPNRLARSYHSGDTADLDFIVSHLINTKGKLFAVVGYSLGGNVLLKWLSEKGSSAPIKTAVAVSVPFDLAACATHLNKGFSRLYQWHLVRSMRSKYQLKFRTRPAAIHPDTVRTLKTFWDFDENVVAPLHGFNGADDYYQRSSCGPRLKNIHTSTLILHAVDDPFVPRHAIPAASALSASTDLELTPAGGHVGFMERHRFMRPRDWSARRILTHLRSHGPTPVSSVQ